MRWGIRPTHCCVLTRTEVPGDGRSVTLMTEPSSSKKSTERGEHPHGQNQQPGAIQCQTYGDADGTLHRRKAVR
jgi:hypothetical protein